MVVIITLINTFVKGMFGLIKQFGLPLTAFFQGKKSAELETHRENVKNAKQSEKIRDGVSRADDSDLDDILHD